MSSAFLRTASGRDLILARPDAIVIEDIAAHLAKLCRFNGACRTFYSVAQHSTLVLQILRDRGAAPATQLWGLLHDAHEYALGDMTRPVEAHVFVGQIPFWRRLKADLDLSIMLACGLGAYSIDFNAVHKADEAALATEWRDLMPGSLPANITAAPVPHTVFPFENWETAREVFLERYQTLRRILDHHTAR
jgi:hypothetical protein